MFPTVQSYDAAFHQAFVFQVGWQQSVLCRKPAVLQLSGNLKILGSLLSVRQGPGSLSIAKSFGAKMFAITGFAVDFPVLISLCG